MVHFSFSPSLDHISKREAHVQRYDTQDAVYDLAWSEVHENQVLAATGDGSIKLFDITLDQFPVQVWPEHNREVLAVQWNLVTKDTFCSSSWDGTIKIVLCSSHLRLHPLTSG